jgi:hypothetical protein
VYICFFSIHRLQKINIDESELLHPVRGTANTTTNTYSNAWEHIDNLYSSVTNRLETHGLKSRERNEELQNRILHLEEMLTIQNLNTNKAIGLHELLLSKASVMELRQKEILDGAESLRRDIRKLQRKTGEFSVIHEIERRRQLLQAMEGVRASHKSAVQVFGDVKLLKQHLLLLEEQSADRTQGLENELRGLKAAFAQARLRADEVESLMSHREPRSCEVAAPVAQSSGALQECEVVLQSMWDAEKAATEALVKSVVCPLNPLAEYCFSDLQRYIHQMIDYAQRNAGAQVVPASTSPTFRYSEASSPLYSSFQNVADLLNIRLENSVSPEMALSRDNSLGNCWPMVGSQGNFTIKLHRPVFISSVSIDHISR